MTDRLERLINLVIALRETRRPMTAAEIRQRVAGYGHSDHEAFRRMFERDKSDLRDLGVPVDTVALDAWDDRPAYRIDPKRYNLPDVSLAPDELAALALAVAATGLQDDAAGGLLKLEVAGGDPGAGRPTATSLGVSLDAPHRETLVAAQVARSAVAFTYRPLEREPAKRTVDPYALVHRRGRWYLVGHDHDRGERRAFRLDRIEGKVKTVGSPGAFQPPTEGVEVDDVIPAPPPDTPTTAEVAASDAVSWQVARRARGGGVADDGGWVRFTVGVRDPDDFVAWILSYGPDVVVVQPPALRDLVVQRLRALA